MRVAFVTTHDPRDIRYWSGTPYYMSRSLEEARLEVCYISPLQKKVNLPVVVRWAYHRYISRRPHHSDREPYVSAGYARQIEKRLRSLHPDVILSTSTLPIARLDTTVPLILWTDATFDGMLNYYPGWTGLSEDMILKGHRTEQEALSRCTRAVYCSDWARETAARYYTIKSDRLRVVPFGANLECDRALEDVKCLIRARSGNCCRLLFIGQEWYRKGGDLAVSVATKLNQRGIPTKLTIIGCIPPNPVPPFVSVQGFISKSTRGGRMRLDQAFASSHFCLVPSRAECLAVAITESASFGVPTIAARTGGIPTIVTDRENGRLCAPESYVEEAVASIQELLCNWAAYERLAQASFEVYEGRLNWRVSAQKMTQLMMEVV